MRHLLLHLHLRHKETLNWLDIKKQSNFNMCDESVHVLVKRGAFWCTPSWKKLILIKNHACILNCYIYTWDKEKLNWLDIKKQRNLNMCDESVHVQWKEELFDTVLLEKKSIIQETWLCPLLLYLHQGHKEKLNWLDIKKQRNLT